MGECETGFQLGSEPVSRGTVIVASFIKIKNAKSAALKSKFDKNQSKTNIYSSPCDNQDSKLNCGKGSQLEPIPRFPCLPPISGPFQMVGIYKEGEHTEEEVITKLPYLQSSPCTPQISPL